MCLWDSDGVAVEVGLIYDGFSVILQFPRGKKKLKTRMTPLAKAKAAQAMEIEK